MSYHPETAAQQFTSAWSKATAWANSQGISAASYLPVYQLDLTRVQNGEYPMSAEERNLAILAAHNPSAVTPVPSDNPSPSNVLSNTVSDAGKIATGLIGIFTGSFERQLWDSAKATYEGVIHPAEMAAPTTGGTIGNWLTKSLLAYLPGAADIGEVLHADPSLTGDAGAKVLAEHPLVSLLDLLPGEGGLLRKAGVEGADKGLLATLATKVGNISTGRAGVTMAGELSANLTVKDAITNMLSKIGPGGAGVGRALGQLAQAYSLAGSLGTNSYAWLMEPAAKALTDLDPEQAALMRKILDTRRATGGDSVRRAMDDPAIDPRVKEALTLWVTGPLRFATEESLFSGQLRPVEAVDGRVGVWVPGSARAARVFAAKGARDAAHKVALATLGRLQPHADAVAALDAMLPKATKAFMDRLVAARKAVAEDDNLAGNVTRPLAKGTRFRRSVGISKMRQVRAVVDEGGLADDFLRAIKENHDPHQIGPLAVAMKGRLSRWGVKSVNAAESPELAALAASVDAFSKWADEYKKEARAIDRAIHGEVDTQKGLRNVHGEMRGRQLQALKDRHQVERDNLAENYRKAGAERRSAAAAKVAMHNDFLATVTARIEADGEAQAARATTHTLEHVIMPKVRGDIAKFRVLTRNALAKAREDLVTSSKIAKLRYDKELAALTKRQHTELDAAKAAIEVEKAGMGDAIRDVSALGRTTERFHRAVEDNPSDEYRDVYVALYEKHLLAHEHSAELVAATMRHAEKAGMGADRIAALRADPQLLAEYMDARFSDIYGDPTMSPEVSAMALAAKKDAVRSAQAELKTLIAQGLRIQYIPSAVGFDERLGRDSLAPVIGRGIPKPDMSKARAWEPTPAVHDFALGINKATVQALQRDTTIEFAEHYLRPLTISREDFATFADRYLTPEARASGGTLRHEYAALADQMGLSAVDPTALFGFGLPRWGHEEMYLPTPMVRAIEQMNKARGGGWRVVSGSTKLFRYSILGLSPRYDAHIIFGGTMMLALRSTPYALTMIGDAARALRDGTLPNELAGHAAVEEGYEEAALRLYHTQGGRDQGTMAVNEHIEQRQGIARAAAKPVHVLRAMADLNFRFTRYVRDLQGAVAYLDGAAKAERRSARVALADPVTGKPITLSADRAMVEGMHHVNEVFGNLSAMSPFERLVATSIMPFYGWQKHILGYVMSFPFDHPWRTLVLSQMAYHASASVPLAYPIRLQLLFQLGSPDSQGNVNAVDIRSLDPFRDVANYASLTGFLESLNPAITAIPSMVDPQFIYGSNVLYPTVTYNDFYGIETAGPQGGLVSGISQWVPQAAAVGTALDAASGIRSTWNTDRSAAIKSMLESLNIPFVTPPVNLKQIAARDEDARYEVAKTTAYNAFTSGDFSTLKGYTTVPNPLNPAYEITPAALQQLYQQAAAASPGVAPIESLLPPPTPYGW